jgi:[FeFe] hydrogenase H-cluster maturation GTPase HydF
LPLGPVVFLDTAGMDDVSVLSELRLKKTRKIFDRSDVIILLLEADIWTEYEENIMDEAGKRSIPIIAVINKIDLTVPSVDFLEELKKKTGRIVPVSSIDFTNRDKYINPLKKHLIDVCPDDYLKPPPLVSDLVPAGGLAVLIVPIDLQAPKGRLILPQVQTIRDCLDNDSACMVVKEREYAHALANLRRQPDIVVCDSQVVLKMTADTPQQVKCTTFSILFSRYKGDLIAAAEGAAVIDTLKPHDRILIAEACSHHPIEDDIGRVKIPRWLRQYIGADIKIDVSSGRDYPENLKDYKLIIHCGGCMLTRREMLFRIEQAREAGVPVTNYGVAVSVVQGVVHRTLSPFPAAYDAYERMRGRIKTEKLSADKV